MKTLVIAILGVGLTAAAFGDTRMKVRYTTGGESTETTVASKGVRQRLEYTNMIVIQQPDQNRFLQLVPAAKTYTSVPMNSAAPASPGNTPKRGSLVMVTTTTTHTSETKQILGKTARRVKTVTARQPTPGACDSMQSTMEIDGWYIDAPSGQAELPSRTPASAAAPACKDEYQHQANGEPNTGFPVAYTMTVSEGSKTTNTSMEVLDLSTATLDAALFEAPAGYTQASDSTDFARRQASAATATASPKTSSKARIGLLGMGDRSGRSLNQEYLAGQLQRSLTSAGVDVVRVFDLDQSKQAGCDYVLSAEIIELKKSTIGQVAGQAAKVSGLFRGGFGRGAAPTPAAAPADEQVEAKIDYRLTPLTEGKSESSGQISAKTGSVISLRTALTLASNVTPMLMMAQMYSSAYSFQVMDQSTGQGTMAMDSTLGAISSWNIAAGAMEERQAPPASEDKAIHAAFDQLAKAIAK